jgi:Ni,Fe-hydrogenase III large subunit
MSYKIPMGPYHPALEEPYKLDLICEGETVIRRQAAYRFQLPRHRAPGRNPQLHSGDRADGARLRHLLQHPHPHPCQAMEGLTGQTPPPRAQYIRVIVAELERLHSHVLWAGIAAKLMGFKTMFMTCFEMREKVMDVLQAISGNRVNYSMNRIGGVNRDIDDPPRSWPWSRQLEREMVRTVIPIFTTSTTARSRCAGIGVLTEEKAISCGVVGPTARASGLPQDLRRAAPYAAYAEMEFDVPCSRTATCAPACWCARWRSWRAARFSARRSPSCLPAKSTPAKQVQLHHRNRHQPRRSAARRGHVQRLLEGGSAIPAASTCARPPLPTCRPSAGWSWAPGLPTRR